MKRMQHGLSKRQRQVMEAVYRLGEASVEDVRQAVPDPPSYSAVRTTMNVLVDRGLLQHTKNGRKYHYSPTIPRHQASHSAVRHLLHTYFDNSLEQAVAALITAGRSGLSDEEYGNLLALIQKARKGA